MKKIPLFLFFLLVIQLFPLTRGVDWTDNITVYPYAVMYVPSIRQIKNNDTQKNVLTVSLSDVQNSSIIKKYRLTGNGTTFIEIDDGSVKIDSNSVHLQPNATIVFDTMAEPTSNVTANSQFVVSVKLELERVTEGEAVVISVIRHEKINVDFVSLVSASPSLIDCIKQSYTITANVSLQNKLLRTLKGTIYWYITPQNNNKTLAEESAEFTINKTSTAYKQLPITVPFNPLADFGKQYILHVYVVSEGERTNEAKILYTLSNGSVIQGLITLGGIGFLAIGVYVFLTRVEIRKPVKKEEE